ncbi:hypothetical protein [Streptomyces sp. NBC_01006]
MDVRLGAEQRAGAVDETRIVHNRTAYTGPARIPPAPAARRDPPIG